MRNAAFPGNDRLVSLLWVPDYGLLVKPLYGALKVAKKGTVVWTDDTRAAF